MQIAAGRMQQLIDDLLAFSRISTTDHKFEKINLSIIIEEVKTELRDTIQEKHATIEATELCSAHIITFQFRQLMYNLISNALKFSKPDIPSHIIVKSRIVQDSKFNNSRLSPEKSYCHITIKDNGIGFEPRFSERIFEVFQKLHGKDVYAGTGIGLAIVKKIVENHNGIITATSELNKGATFDIYIPAA
jgi:two-component system CheB/CheR fusion protein